MHTLADLASLLQRADITMNKPVRCSELEREQRTHCVLPARARCCCWCSPCIVDVPACAHQGSPRQACVGDHTTGQQASALQVARCQCGMPTSCSWSGSFAVRLLPTSVRAPMLGRSSDDPAVACSASSALPAWRPQQGRIRRASDRGSRSGCSTNGAQHEGGSRSAAGGAGAPLCCSQALCCRC